MFKVLFKNQIRQAMLKEIAGSYTLVARCPIRQYSFQ